jgi:hypothetical protein
MNKPAIPFTPVPLRHRHDGWTADRQIAFLKALAATCCVADACKAVGMSRDSAYDLRARPSAVAFRAAWLAALDCGIDRGEDAAVSRWINGVPRPIFYKGEQVGEWREFDERLTMFMLRHRRPQRYSEEAVRKALEPLPSLDMDLDCGPDPDEAMGRLDYYLDELTDFGAPPTKPDEPLRANDGVDFVDFQREQPGEGGEGGELDGPRSPHAGPDPGSVPQTGGQDH